MKLALSLKTLALLAFVAASTAVIVHPARTADGTMAMAHNTTNGLPLPSSFH
ncbi:hypothetical protein SAMN05192549_10275 [Duganella sacchari]|uniref:Uncharacterized protein n=1 Tax=Duganella sacchari TaxID=551987 RepID=A0A1M7KG81_9BURK|nr:MULTISPECIES: hypothetical protein [Duganella]MYM28464.1 hypothetical protein [Duganella sp. CY15W]SHM63855.1 hypothetical protein SAMN05192549_10275 [Duganella sacchari]